MAAGITFNISANVSMEIQSYHSHIMIRILQPWQHLESIVLEFLGVVGCGHLNRTDF